MHWIHCLLATLGLTCDAPHDDRPHCEPAATVAAPEIDPTTLTGPLTLLGLGTLILTDHRRRTRA